MGRETEKECVCACVCMCVRVCVHACVRVCVCASLHLYQAHLVKNLPTMLETWVQSLGWEDPLEEGTATHSRILAWKVPWTV